MVGLAFGVTTKGRSEPFKTLADRDGFVLLMGRIPETQIRR